MKADGGEGKEGIVEDVQEMEKEAPETQENMAAVALQSTVYTALKEQLESLQKVFIPDSTSYFLYFTSFLSIPLISIHFSIYSLSSLCMHALPTFAPKLTYFLSSHDT